MNEQDLQVPSQFVGVVEERHRLWEHYDQAKHNAAKFDTLARKVPSNGPIDHIALLTTDGSPPDEVRVVITSLQNDLAKVSREEAQIKQLQEEIQRIRNHAQSMLILISLSLIAIIAFLLYTLF